MSSLGQTDTQALAQEVVVTEDTLRVDLVDGRSISVPLAWYPRLWYATPEERSNLEMLGSGSHIHWPDVDEDLTVAGIVAGKRSKESQESIKKWLAGREPAR